MCLSLFTFEIKTMFTTIAILNQFALALFESHSKPVLIPLFDTICFLFGLIWKFQSHPIDIGYSHEFCV